MVSKASSIFFLIYTLEIYLFVRSVMLTPRCTQAEPKSTTGDFRGDHGIEYSSYRVFSFEMDGTKGVQSAIRMG